MRACVRSCEAPSPGLQASPGLGCSRTSSGRRQRPNRTRCRGRSAPGLSALTARACGSVPVRWGAPLHPPVSRAAFLTPPAPPVLAPAPRSWALGLPSCWRRTPTCLGGRSSPRAPAPHPTRARSHSPPAAAVHTVPSRLASSRRSQAQRPVDPHVRTPPGPRNSRGVHGRASVLRPLPDTSAAESPWPGAGFASGCGSPARPSHRSGCPAPARPSARAPGWGCAFLGGTFETRHRCSDGTDALTSLMFLRHRCSYVTDTLPSPMLVKHRRSSVTDVLPSPTRLRQ